MGTKHRTIAVIDLGDASSPSAEASSRRFAARRLGSHSLVHRIARRLSDATQIDHLIISGRRLPAHLLTSGLPGVEILDLPQAHVCERLATAADRHHADWVVYVPGNHPFVDPALIDSLVNRAHQSLESPDYVGYCGMGGCWDRVRHLGVAGELCHSDALRRLRRHVDRLPTDDRPMAMADWLDNAPGKYEMVLIPLPSLLDQQDFRFAIEDEGDWECAEMFSDYLGDERTEWQVLADLVRDNSMLRGAMADRNRMGQAHV